MHSIAPIAAVALALAGSATAKHYQLMETYDSTNFFDKFDFFESKFTGNPKDIDPAGGHVIYQSRENAVSKGLIAYHGDEIYVGVDHETIGSANATGGRPSVRLESKNEYLKGLMIARFSHLPKNQCSVWPEFWTKGNNRPHDGQIDMYENWNEATTNHPALHTGLTSDVGQCLISSTKQTASILSSNCDNNYSDSKQGKGSGCAVNDGTGPWANSDGGVFAMEWTDDYLKLFTWHPDAAPANIHSHLPDTSHWGNPTLYVKNDECNINKHFGAQKLVLHITFCGVAGTSGFWGQTCQAKTKQDQCIDYVSQSPADFKDVFWKIKDIRYFAPKSCKRVPIMKKF